MQIKINAHHLNLGEEQEQFIEGKIANLRNFAGRLGDESSIFTVDMIFQEARKDDEKYRCEVTLFAPRGVIRAEADAESMETALDRAIDKTHPQIEKYKARFLAHNEGVETIVNEIEEAENDALSHL